MRGKKAAALMLVAGCICTLAAAGWGGMVQASEVSGEQQPQEETPEGGQTQEETPEGEQTQEIGWPAAPELEGERAILMEANSGTILYEKNAHEQGYPASITKIATAIVAIENGDFDDNVTFSADAVFKTEGSGIWRDVDEVMTLEECMYAMMLESANECAYAIAEHVGGSYENFIDMMNAKAAELGCTGTHFNNPHGLPDEEHLTTCYDMALISSYAINNDTFRKIVGTLRYDIPPTNKHEEITYLTNHHKMMKQSESVYYAPCIGGKTGYTTAAGNTLVTFAEQDGVTLVCVVMQENTSIHYADTRILLDWGFEHFTNYNISENMADSAGSMPENDFLVGGDFTDIDRTAVVTLPVGVPFTETLMEVVPGKDDPRIAATLQFMYQDRKIGTAVITQVAEELARYPFREEQDSSMSSLPSQPEGEPQSQPEGEPQSQPEPQSEPQEQTEETEKFSVNPWLIGGIVLGVAVLGALGFGIFKFVDNFHLIRYKWMNRRGRQMHYKIVDHKPRRRRR